MANKEIALVTGANKGIGYEIARQLLEKGLLVVIGSRDLKNGEQAAKELGADAHALQLDVTDPASIQSAAKTLAEKFGHLDVLVNNAAIASTNKKPGTTLAEYSSFTKPSTLSLEEMRTVWETNVYGPLMVYQAMLPLLRKAPRARIVNVSSAVGSLSLQSNPNFPFRSNFSPVYPGSKTALNAITLSMAIELEKEGIKVNAVTPGFTKTALNGFEGTDTPANGARSAVYAATLGEDGPTGTFINQQLEKIQW